MGVLEGKAIRFDRKASIISCSSCALEIVREKGNATYTFAYRRTTRPLVSSAGLPYCMHGNRVYALEKVSLTFFLSITYRSLLFTFRAQLRLVSRFSNPQIRHQIFYLSRPITFYFAGTGRKRKQVETLSR